MFSLGEHVKYFSPTSVEEAVGLLESGGARVFAGATDLIPQLRAGRPEPESLVDLKRIDRLVSLTRNDSHWTVGAATPTVRLTEDAELADIFPGLIEAAGLIGSDQIQSRCSLGGNLCNASPAADSVPAMVVNRMRAVIATGSATRPSRSRTSSPAPAGRRSGPTSSSWSSSSTARRHTAATPTCGSSRARRWTSRWSAPGPRHPRRRPGAAPARVIALGAVAPTVVRVAEAEAAVVGTCTRRRHAGGASPARRAPPRPDRRQARHDRLSAPRRRCAGLPRAEPRRPARHRTLANGPEERDEPDPRHLHRQRRRRSSSCPRPRDAARRPARRRSA